MDICGVKSRCGGILVSSDASEQERPGLKSLPTQCGVCMFSLSWVSSVCTGFLHHQNVYIGMIPGWKYI